MGSCYSFIRLLYADEKIKPFAFQSCYMRIPKNQIYDGDTCKALLLFRGKIIKTTIRMYGYDSPEMKPSKKLPNRDKIKKKAKEAKEFLAATVGDKIVWADTTHGFDKYGRLLADIYLTKRFYKTIHVNKSMIEAGHGKPYFGGTKT